MLRRLETADRNLEKTGGKAIKDNTRFILELVKENQLGKGLDSKGDDIVHPFGNGYYAPKTENYWAKKSPYPTTSKRSGRKYDMEWTGTFKDTMDISIEGSKYQINSSTKRAMEDIYKTKLTDLNDDNEKLVNEVIIEPKLYESIFSAITK